MADSTSSATQGQKSSFDGLYDRDDPVHYFTTLRRFDYRTPAHAQPIFRRCVSQLRQLRGGARISILDLCCGYGVNAALINHDLTLDDLYRHYGRAAKTAPGARRDVDRRFFRMRRRTAETNRMIGLDIAAHALSYARQVGLLDEALAVNLESDTLTTAQRAAIAEADLVTVTGGLSYIGVRTFLQVLSAFPPSRRPWVAFFPLRHMDSRSIAALFRSHGMVTEAWEDRGFKHREFTDACEREALIDLIDDEADPLQAPPSQKSIEAVFHLARPHREAAVSPLSRIVEGPAGPRGTTGDTAWSSQG